PMPDAPPVTATTLPSSFNQSAIFDFLLFEILLFCVLFVCSFCFVFCLFSFADLILVKRRPWLNSDRFHPSGNPLVQ
ncbi:MAG: hypothetical protein II628_15125, partial [Lachnospiraceae bacterium]|nr:hypothetical protein [Lachnospiraceae bacterium]